MPVYGQRIAEPTTIALTRNGPPPLKRADKLVIG